ncbi:MAG: MmgE/PrpD family protein [Myxococcaceae bacterium]|nr:MmgE/PrpD family protein [Myxococcaceae bacterium]
MSTPTLPKLTLELATWIASARWEEFPEAAIATAKRGIVDCVGCTLAGSAQPIADILADFTGETGGAPKATVLGRGLRTSAPAAALMNAAMAHSLAYDDINSSIKGHPSVVLVPTALALAEEEELPGRDVVLAYMVGFEVACRIGAALSVAYADKLGWHPTAPIGAVAAAAASSRLLRLDAEQTAMALSLAASQACGLRQNFGTMTKSLHAGLACRSGVTSARLVKAGFTASTEGLEGRFGFLHAFSGGADYEPSKLTAGLGSRYYLVDEGLQIKKYPCCASTHLTLDVLFSLLEDERVETAQVDRVHVLVDFDPPRSLIYDIPTTGGEGKFSMPYVMAAALLDRRIHLSTFEDSQVLRPEAQELLRRVTMTRNPGHEGRPSWAERSTGVRLVLKDGRTLERGASRPPELVNGITPDELRTKFLDCAAFALPAEPARRLLGWVETLEVARSVREVVSLASGR